MLMINKVVFFSPSIIFERTFTRFLSPEMYIKSLISDYEEIGTFSQLHLIQRGSQMAWFVYIIAY